MTILCAAALMTELALPAEALTSNDVVYYGNYPQDDETGQKKDPILWRVLEVSGDQGLMLSEKIIDGGILFNADRHDTIPYYHWWSETNIRKFLNGKEYVKSVSADETMIEVDNPKDYSFYETAFSAGEGNGILKAEVDNSSTWSMTPGPKTTDKIFLLSFANVRNTAYGFTDNMGSNDPSRKAELTNYGASQEVDQHTEGDKTYGSWYLRSPGGSNNAVACITQYGYLNTEQNSVHGYGLRPVFRLNLKSLLFTSPAKDGKQSGVTTVLKKQEYNGEYTHKPTSRDFTEHKLTLAAERYKLEDAILKSGEIAEGTSIDVTVDYSGASTGTDYHLAVVVTSGDKALYYGQIKSLKTPDTANGSANFTIPEYHDGEEVYVFVEGRNNNGNYKTDFASLPKYLKKNNVRDITYALPDVEEPLPDTDSISISPLPLELTIAKGSSYQLTVSFTPYDALEEIEWSSGNPTVATVDTNGLVTAQQVGNTTITATTKQSKKTTKYTVIVTENTQGPGIILTPMAMTISKGVNADISVTFKDIDKQPLTWKSDDENIATVDKNGTVTAISEGECKITAKTADGEYDETCEVKVVAATQIHSGGGGSGGCNAGIPVVVTLLTLGSLIYIRSRNGK